MTIPIEKCINSIRCLAAETVQKANSGHPGAPMGCAPIAHTLWSSVMNFSPKDPKWINRDRFVLSNGHACALLYTMLHLTGYDLSMDDLKQFRQYESKTPGHPEIITPGVEVNTGPLGQGLTNAVGMAIAESNLAAHYNKPEFPVIDNYIYVLAGDGCLEEGISHEAASLAGHLQLGRLIVLYDDNHITIDGNTNLSFTDNTIQRFASYGWDVDHVDNGDHDVDAIYSAIERAKRVTDKPSIIAVHTTIGYGSPVEGTSAVHGTPIGWPAIDVIREKWGFKKGEYFTVEDDVCEIYHAAGERGEQLEEAWNTMMKKYSHAYPQQYEELHRRLNGELIGDVVSILPDMSKQNIAGRTASGLMLNALMHAYPEIVGGSADLTSSNGLSVKGIIEYSATSQNGSYIHFGVREHAMAAICNGLYAYGGFLPFCSTFFVFSGYCMGALRLSAISNFKVLYVFTHDSIGVGEDGPTHQPIEHLWQLRSMPNILVIRPADGREVAGSYVTYMNHNGPTVLVLSRQTLPALAGSSIDGVSKGGYVVRDGTETPDLVLLSTGSEVSMCIEAADKMKDKNVRVVSVPCVELFEQQSLEYKKSILCENVPIISVEAGATNGWERFSHFQMGVNTFGLSAPASKVYDHFNINVDNIIRYSEKILLFYTTRVVPSKFDVYME